MSRWSYHAVQVSSGSMTNANQSFIIECDKLGHDGWELIQVCYHHIPHEVIVSGYFKKPIVPPVSDAEMSEILGPSHG